MNGLQEGGAVDLSKYNLDRFWKRVSVGSPDACWEWQGSLTTDGYGALWINPRCEGAHRISWEIAYGPIPGKLGVLHKCDNRKCCNPNHLFLGTQSDNARDMWDKGRGRGGHHKQPNTWSRGEGNGRAKLTWAQVEEIRELFATGNYAKRELARRFKVGYTLIGLIVRHRLWVKPPEEEAS